MRLNHPQIHYYIQVYTITVSTAEYPFYNKIWLVLIQLKHLIFVKPLRFIMHNDII